METGVIMKPNNVLNLISILFLMLVSSLTQAAGLMKPANSGLPDLEIREHHVNVVNLRSG
jgi:hypothetical protein